MSYHIILYFSILYYVLLFLILHYVSIWLFVSFYNIYIYPFYVTTSYYIIGLSVKLHYLMKYNISTIHIVTYIYIYIYIYIHIDIWIYMTIKPWQHTCNYGLYTLFGFGIWHLLAFVCPWEMRSSRIYNPKRRIERTPDRSTESYSNSGKLQCMVSKCIEDLSHYLCGFDHPT